MVWVCTASVLEATAPTLGLTRKLPFVFISVNNLRESSRLEKVEIIIKMEVKTGYNLIQNNHVHAFSVILLHFC